MRNKSKKHLGIEVEPELLIRQCIRDFESKHGEIPFDQKQE